MKFKIGDVVQIGNVVGNIVSVNKQKKTGFFCGWMKDKFTYNVQLTDVPEDLLTPDTVESDGTD